MMNVHMGLRSPLLWQFPDDPPPAFTGILFPWLLIFNSTPNSLHAALQALNLQHVCFVCFA
jgi:hypothetical protein